jgi:toxin ParE1/3/4
MARVIVSLLAQADTTDIITYLAGQAGYGVAVGYAASFEALYERLASHPDSGAPRPAIGHHIRIGIVSPYIVIYEYDKVSDMVTIFRFVHGRRRITGKMLTGDKP